MTPLTTGLTRARIADLVIGLNKDILNGDPEHSLRRRINNSNAYSEIEERARRSNEILAEIPDHFRKNGLGDGPLAEQIKEGWIIVFRWLCAASKNYGHPEGLDATFDEWSAYLKTVRNAAA